MTSESLHMIIISNLSFNPPRNLSFYGLVPDEFTESHTAEYDPIKIKSRSSDLAAYSGSASRTVELSIDVHEDYLKQYNGSSYTINQFVNQIKALTYPRYQGGIVIPPRCYIKIGPQFRMKAYCNSCSITWKKPIRDKKYIAASISLSLTEMVYVSFSADEIFSGDWLGRYTKYHG